MDIKNTLRPVILCEASHFGLKGILGIHHEKNRHWHIDQTVALCRPMEGVIGLGIVPTS